MQSKQIHQDLITAITTEIFLSSLSLFKLSCSALRAAESALFCQRLVVIVTSPFTLFFFFYIKFNFYTARRNIEMTVVTAHYILPCGLPGWGVPVTFYSSFTYFPVYLFQSLSMSSSCVTSPLRWFVIHVEVFSYVLSRSFLILYFSILIQGLH